MKLRRMLRCQCGPKVASVLVLMAAAVVAPAAARAQTTPPPAVPSSPAAEPQDPYDTVVRELTDLLVARQLLTRKEADALLARVREKVAAERMRRAQAAGTPEPDGADTIRVVYLSELEKERIRAELRQEIMAQAQAENWAQPEAVPAWLRRVELGGDLRVRYELDAFDSDNAPFVNYQAINSGAPYDVNVGVTNFNLPPILNTTEDRRLLRLRARLGLVAEIASNVRAELSLATGSTSNPVSTNQTLGADFNKVSLLLDRAAIAYRPTAALTFTAGRFANPFASTELVWDADLNLDGLATRFELWDTFLTVGAFPVGNTPHDFPSNQIAKIGGSDKWLYGAQFGTTWGLSDGGSVTLVSSYYHFNHVEGRRSSPCTATSSSVQCDTDPSRPGFVQKGNTLFEIRDVQATAAEPQFQYFGLASPFHELSAMAQVRLPVGGGLEALLESEAVVNLAYDEAEARRKRPVNNLGEEQCDADGNCRSPYDGGGVGFLAQVTFGHPKVAAQGRWNVATGYRRLDSDAVVDAYTDSDFHLGGTNARGYVLGGALGLTEGFWLSLRWLSAIEASAAPLANDVYQLDFNARF